MSKAHPAPKGKDIGEFVQLDGNLRQWLLSGLPDEFCQALEHLGEA